MPTSDPSFRHRPGSRHINDEGCDQVAQVDAMVEPVGKGCKVVIEQTDFDFDPLLKTGAGDKRTVA